MEKVNIGLFENNDYNNDPDVNNEFAILQNQLAKEEEMKKKQEEKIRKIEEEKNLAMTEEEKSKIKEIIDKRLFEYGCAEKYFKKNKLIDRLEITKQILQNLEIEKNNCIYGRWKDLKRKNIPDEITPNFIFNCSDKERKKEFDEIINKLEIKKFDYDHKIKALNAKFMNNKEKYEDKDEKDKLKKEFDSIKYKREYYINQLKKIKSLKTNKWAYPPKIEYEAPKENKFIQENTINIQFYSLNLINKDIKNLYIQIKLDNITPIQQLGPLENTNDNSFQKEISLPIKTEDFNTIYKRKIKIEVFLKNLFKNTNIDAFEIDLLPLKDNNEFNPKVKIINNKNINNNKEAKILINIKTRYPCEKENPDFRIISYPPFSFANEEDTSNSSLNDININKENIENCNIVRI